MKKHSKSYDYVIVGSGAAGAILANRLSEDANVSVCLLEAGPADYHPFIHLPAGFVKMIFNPSFAWQFKTEPDAATFGRQIPIPQGKTLGGSTSINGLVYNRGQHSDYDHWAALGNPGWNFEGVLPYFKKNERRPQGGSDPLRGYDGPLPISDIEWKHPILDAFIEGAVGLGIPRNPDYNGATQDGVGFFQRSIHNGFRMSTARAYLSSAKKRENLTILTGAHATKILIKDKVATGIQFVSSRRPDEIHEVLASREVIISAGAINTPKLLQLSGIGSREVLNDIGVRQLHELAGVGEHLKDHYSVRIVGKVKNSKTINEEARGLRLGKQVLNWALRRPSILALSPSLVHIFWKTDEALAQADLQGVFTPASYKEGYVGMLDNYPGMTCGFWQHRPHSQGYVRARSSNPFETPLVAPNYLHDERDQKALIAGVRLARRLLSSPELSHYYESEALPGSNKQSDAELLDFVRRYGVSSYHLNGTAKMGSADDDLAVVDAELRVHGLKNLRVIDSSVMPEIPSANICAATMMIAEKGAALIKG